MGTVQALEPWRLPRKAGVLVAVMMGFEELWYV